MPDIDKAEKEKWAIYGIYCPCCDCYEHVWCFGGTAERPCVSEYETQPPGHVPSPPIPAKYKDTPWEFKPRLPAYRGNPILALVRILKMKPA